jgi:sec-independent protein translocase protein TatC
MPLKVLPSDPEQVRMTFGEHLEELRWRLMKALAAVAVGIAIAFVFSDPVVAFFVEPYLVAARWQGSPQFLVALHPTEVFMVVMKLCALVGVILSSPYAFYQVWAFVAAGLYPRERRTVTRMVPASVGLFLTGVAFLFYVVLPVALRVLMAMNTWVPMPEGKPNWLVSMLMGPKVTATAPSTQPQISRIPVLAEDPIKPSPGTWWVNQTQLRLKVAIDKDQTVVSDLHVSDAGLVQSQFDVEQYVSFVVGLAFAFGLGFQVPLVVLLLSRIGIVSARQMAGARRVVILVVFIAAAVITPTPDIWNMTLLAVPMILLFEVGLVLARRSEKKHPPLRESLFGSESAEPDSQDMDNGSLP